MFQVYGNVNLNLKAIFGQLRCNNLLKGNSEQIYPAQKFKGNSELTSFKAVMSITTELKRTHIHRLICLRQELYYFKRSIKNSTLPQLSKRAITIVYHLN